MPGSLSCGEASQILEAARRGGCIVHVAWTTDPSRQSRHHEAAARVMAGDIGTLQAVYCGCDAGLAELEVAARVINLAAAGTLSVVPAGSAAVLGGREAHGASIAFSDAAAVITGGTPGMTTGTAGLIKTGGGLLQLSNPNNLFSGGVDVQAGGLVVSGSSSPSTAGAGVPTYRGWNSPTRPPSPPHSAGSCIAAGRGCARAAARGGCSDRG
jgi:autotransporter-associated beta strand protein